MPGASRSAAPIENPEACRDYAASLTARLDERLAKEAGPLSWQVTVPCSRAQGEAIGAMASFQSSVNPRRRRMRPDESRPDEWLIHAYFEREPRG